MKNLNLPDDDQDDGQADDGDETDALDLFIAAVLSTEDTNYGDPYIKPGDD